MEIDDEGGGILFGSKKIHPTAKELALLKKVDRLIASKKKVAIGEAAATNVKGSKVGEAAASQSASKKGGGASDSVDHELRVRSGLLAVLLTRPDIDAIGRAHDLLVRGVQAALMVAKACGARRPVPAESLLLLDLVLLGGPTALYASLSGVAKQSATASPTVPSHLTPYDIPLAVLFSVRHGLGRGASYVCKASPGPLPYSTTVSALPLARAEGAAQWGSYTRCAQRPSAAS